MNSSRDFRDLDGADPWKLLGVSRSAGADEIKRNYRRLSRSHHTDVGGDSTQQAKLNRAYEILTDPTRSADYARLLQPKPRPQAPVPPSEPESGSPAEDPFAWAAGPPTWSTPRPSSQPPPTPPPYKDPYEQPYRDPYTEPPYSDPPYYDPATEPPYTDPPYRDPRTPPGFADSYTPPPRQKPYTPPRYQDPYVEPQYQSRGGVSGQAVAALLTVAFCAPLSIYLAITALRTIQLTGQRGKTVAWLALLGNAAFIIFAIIGGIRSTTT